MAKLKFDQETMGLSSLMEQMTRARVKDCFKENDIIYFVVAQGDLMKAVGKNGSIIRNVQERLGKQVRIIELRNDVVSFVRSIIYPISVEEIVEEESLIIIRDSDRKKKGQIIGRSGTNLELVNKIVKRFFDREVKVA